MFGRVLGTIMPAVPKVINRLTYEWKDVDVGI